MLAPLDHPDPAHCLVTGTGLTHLGSAQARDAMHQAMQQAEDQLSDSMKMFRLGLEGGRPEGGGPGVAPEWFYKGDGSIVAAPGQPLTMPGFALDGGEEAEIAMLYVIDDDGRPCRVGYALGNEFADHVLERQNYLYLAHSKLRPVRVRSRAAARRAAARRARQDQRGARRGADLAGGVHLRRGQHVAHARQSRAPSLQIPAVPPPGRRARPLHRRRGAELHRRHQGRAPGDVFEIDVPAFGAPLRNPLALAPDEGMVRVKQL